MQWCILLTTTVYVYPPHQLGRNTPEQRRSLYLNAIRSWLQNTIFDIFVVDSSGYSFPELEHERLHVYSFKVSPDRASGSTSQLEAETILAGTKKFSDEMRDFTHLLKITGRYYLSDIQEALQNVPNHVDICLQHTHQPTIKWQNSELFGFRKSLAEEIFAPILEIGYMEQRLFAVSEQYPNQYRLPPIHNTLMVPRGGDGLTIRDL